jgi:mannosylglycerate hydrolase
VTQDKTANDTLYRLDQSIELSTVAADKAMQNLIHRIDLSQFDSNSALIVVFNSQPYSRREIIEAWINLPPASNKDIFGPPEGLRVFDAEDNPVSMQWSGFEDKYYPVAELHTRAFPYKCQRHRFFFDTGQLPAGGYKVFRVCHLEQEDNPINGRADWSDSQSRTDTLLTSPDSMENEYVRIEMNGNGTFDLIDKQTGKTYRKLNYYEDRGEHGNYWVNHRPMHDRVHTSLGCNARIWSQDSGPLQATLVSEITMELPSNGIPKQQCRGNKLEDLVIRTYLTVKKGQSHVEVNVELTNCHQDHYLRAMFPTYLSEATHADAGGHFIVDHRPIRPQGATPDSVWVDMATLPQNKFVDLSDGKTGFAFINEGLTEYEVTNTRDRVVALSLLKAVKNWICTERVGSDFPSQKGGQLLGSHSFRYALLVHAGNWQDANVLKLAESFNTPVVPVQTNAAEGTLPSNKTSFFSLNNLRLGFSAFKKAADSDSYILRVYNPTDSNQDAVLTIPSGVSKAWYVSLNEERQSEINITNMEQVSFSVASYKIASIEISAVKI